MKPANRLQWLMRANAGVLFLAVIPVFFPTAWMERIHEYLGLGPFPKDRLTEYLTRSVAACYALHGAVVFLLSTDVIRYRPMLPKLYSLHLIFAAFLLGIDLFAGMPIWWTIVEPGTIAGVAISMLVILRISR